MSDKLYVQAGKSVTSLKGIIDHGFEVTAEMFKGEKSIFHLKAAGIIGDKPDLRTKVEINEVKAKAKATAKEKAEKK